VGETRREQTQAVAYINGRCFFKDAGAALATATSSQHRIDLAGWPTDLRVPLTPAAGPTLQRYPGNTRAQVRGLF